MARMHVRAHSRRCNRRHATSLCSTSRAARLSWTLRKGPWRQHSRPFRLSRAWPSSPSATALGCLTCRATHRWHFTFPFSTGLCPSTSTRQLRSRDCWHPLANAATRSWRHWTRCLHARRHLEDLTRRSAWAQRWMHCVVQVRGLGDSSRRAHCASLLARRAWASVPPWAQRQTYARASTAVSRSGTRTSQRWPFLRAWPATCWWWLRGRAGSRRWLSLRRVRVGCSTTMRTAQKAPLCLRTCFDCSAVKRHWALR
mmetsp:Transcript_15108/g.62827  ORF Transcript_15108/g.62827 Transcript_15108/m.62827 type:complete len:256 (+) Transcript_15108:145-912(+)